MVKGILGRKLGMTQVFTKSGKLVPTAIIVNPIKSSPIPNHLLILTALLTMASADKPIKTIPPIINNIITLSI